MTQATENIEIEVADEDFELIFDWASESLTERGMIIPEDLSDYGDHLELLEKATLLMITTEENFSVFLERVGGETPVSKDEVFIDQVDDGTKSYKVLRATEKWAIDVQIELQNAAWGIETVEVPAK